MTERASALRAINPIFQISESGGPKTRKGRRAALLTQTASARRGIALAEHYARLLDLPDVERQLAITRELLEATHIAVRSSS